MATDGDDTSSTIYIDDLIATNPSGSQYKYEGDEHLRFIKKVLKNTFPNITGPITATETELNYVDGVTSQLSGNSQTATLTSKTINNPIIGGILERDAFYTANVDAGAVTIAPTAAANDKFYTGPAANITSLTFTGTVSKYRDITWIFFHNGSYSMADTVWPSNVYFTGTAPAIPAGTSGNYSIFKFQQYGTVFICYAYAINCAPS